MAWANQATGGDMTEAQIGLFVRTGPFAGQNLIAHPNEQEIDSDQPHTNNLLRSQSLG